MFNHQASKIRTGLIIWWILIVILEIHGPFQFLILNTFLAYVPIEIGLDLNYKKINRSLLFWPLLIIWLLFYPNAPYLITDFFHLSFLNPYDSSRLIRLSTSVWVNYTLLTVSALVSIIISSLGLMNVACQITRKCHAKRDTNRFIIVILTTLSSVGVFIGRFLRIHTVYLLISPHLFVQPLIQMWRPAMLRFVILFTFIQLTVDWLIKIAQTNLSHKRLNRGR